MNRRTIRRLAMLAGLLVSSGAVYANTSITSTITEIEVVNNGHYFVYFSGTISGTPSGCSPSAHNVYAVDGTTATGKTMLAIIEAAYLQGKTVFAEGNNTCNVNSADEDLFDFYNTN